MGQFRNAYKISCVKAESRRAIGSAWEENINVGNVKQKWDADFSTETISLEQGIIRDV